VLEPLAQYAYCMITAEIPLDYVLLLKTKRWIVPSQQWAVIQQISRLSGEVDTWDTSGVSF